MHAAVRIFGLLPLRCAKVCIASERLRKAPPTHADGIDIAFAAQAPPTTRPLPASSARPSEALAPRLRSWHRQGWQGRGELRRSGRGAPKSSAPGCGAGRCKNFGGAKFAKSRILFGIQTLEAQDPLIFRYTTTKQKSLTVFQLKTKSIYNQARIYPLFLNLKSEFCRKKLLQCPLSNNYVLSVNVVV